MQLTSEHHARLGASAVKSRFSKFFATGKLCALFVVER
jgi:hypothetical protein